MNALDNPDHLRSERGPQHKIGTSSRLGGNPGVDLLARRDSGIHNRLSGRIGARRERNRCHDRDHMFSPACDDQCFRHRNAIFRRNHRDTYGGKPSDNLLLFGLGYIHLHGVTHQFLSRHEAGICVHAIKQTGYGARKVELRIARLANNLPKTNVIRTIRGSRRFRLRKAC